MANGDDKTDITYIVDTLTQTSPTDKLIQMMEQRGGHFDELNNIVTIVINGSANHQYPVGIMVQIIPESHQTQYHFTCHDSLKMHTHSKAIRSYLANQHHKDIY